LVLGNSKLQARFYSNVAIDMIKERKKPWALEVLFTLMILFWFILLWVLIPIDLSFMH
jgi:hypothetical protein